MVSLMVCMERCDNARWRALSSTAGCAKDAGCRRAATVECGQTGTLPQVGHGPKVLVAEIASEQVGAADCGEQHGGSISRDDPSPAKALSYRIISPVTNRKYLIDRIDCAQGAQMMSLQSLRFSMKTSKAVRGGHVK